VYRLLLWLAFPRRLRQEFGDEMLRLFEAHREAVRASGGSVTRLWLDAIADAIVHGTGERLARVEVAGLATVRELRRWRWWVRAFLQDVRYSFRLFLKQPGVALIAVFTLALGIGANAAIFSAADAVLFRPLPYPEPDRLVKVWEKREREGVLKNVVAPADFVDWSRMNGAFEAMAGFVPTTADLTGSGEPVRLFAAAVSTPFFDILRVQPALGRTFRPEEGKIGQHRVVILGHRLWERRFGSDVRIVGQKVVLNGIPHDVVGVLPRSFEFPDRTIELWAPFAVDGESQPLPRASHSLEVFARLKDGVSVERARAEMDRVAAELQRQYPDTNRTHGAHVTLLRDELTGPVRTGLLLLFGAVAFVLLISCVNVANLLLARAAARRREMAVRAALGAGRGRLAGQSLTESLVLALMGGAVALVVALAGIEIMRALAPAHLPVVGISRIGLEPRVLAFTLAVSLLTSVLFGLLPAWHLASQDVNDALKDGSRAAGGVRRRLRTSLVVTEVALASLLLVAAGLTLRSFQTLLRTEPGFETGTKLTMLISLPRARYQTEEKRLLTFAEIERRFAGMPGVRSVGVTSRLPLGIETGRIGVGIEGRQRVPDEPTRAHPRAISSDYFRTMGMTLAAGRSFTAVDRAGSPLVAIVNETMAQRYWPGSSPVGRRVRLGGTDGWIEVVGVVRDVRSWGLENPVNPELYMPLGQWSWSSPFFVLDVEGEPTAVAGNVREQLRAVDPDLPLSSVRTMGEVAAQSVATRRSSMLLLAIFGALALTLAAAGIYGVMAHLVALRTAEIGVRMTLGARPPDVVRMVLREALLQAGAGLAIGVTGGVLLMRSFRFLLYGIHPADPTTLLAVVLILIATAIAACLVPARRAMKVDPVNALRAT
jgi:putative ABC transport system permease protein